MSLSPDPDWREKAKRLRASGLTLSEISRLLGKPSSTIGDVLKPRMRNKTERRVRSAAARALGGNEEKRGHFGPTHYGIPKPRLPRKIARTSAEPAVIKAACEAFGAERITLAELRRALVVGSGPS